MAAVASATYPVVYYSQEVYDVAMTLDVIGES